MININELLLGYYDILLYLHLKNTKNGNNIRVSEYTDYLNYLLDDNLICSNVYGKTRCSTTVEIVKYIYEAKNAKDVVKINGTVDCNQIERRLINNFKIYNMASISIQPDHIFYIVKNGKNEYFVMSSWIYLYKFNIVKIDNINIFIGEYINCFCKKNNNKLSLDNVNIDKYYRFLTKYFIYKADIQNESLYICNNINNISDILHNYDFIYKDFYGIDNKNVIVNHISEFTFYDVNDAYFNVENLKSTILADLYRTLINREITNSTVDVYTTLFNWINDAYFAKIYTGSPEHNMRVNTLIDKILDLLNIFNTESSTVIVFGKPKSKMQHIVQYGGHIRPYRLIASDNIMKKNKNMYYEYLYKQWKYIYMSIKDSGPFYEDIESFLFINKNNMYSNNNVYDINNENILLANANMKNNDLILKNFINDVNTNINGISLKNSLNNIQGLLTKLNTSNCMQIIASYNNKKIIIYLMIQNLSYDKINTNNTPYNTYDMSFDTYVAYIKYKDQLNIINFELNDVISVFRSKYKIINDTYYKSFRNINNIILEKCNIYYKPYVEQINYLESVIIQKTMGLFYIDHIYPLPYDSNNYTMTIYPNLGKDVIELAYIQNIIQYIAINSADLSKKYGIMLDYFTNRKKIQNISTYDVQYLYLYKLLYENYNNDIHGYDIHNIISKYNSEIHYIKFFIKSTNMFEFKKPLIENINYFYHPFV